MSTFRATITPFTYRPHGRKEIQHIHIHTFLSIRRMILPLRVLHKPGVMTIIFGRAKAPTRVFASYRISDSRSGYLLILFFRVIKQHRACPLISSGMPTTAASLTCLCLLIALSSCATKQLVPLLNTLTPTKIKQP